MQTNISFLLAAVRMGLCAQALCRLPGRQEGKVMRNPRRVRSSGPGHKAPKLSALGSQGCPRPEETPPPWTGVSLGAPRAPAAAASSKEPWGQHVKRIPGISAHFSSLPLQGWGRALLTQISRTSELLSPRDSLPGSCWVLLSASPGFTCCRCSRGATGPVAGPL